jgi:hypothetical protein
MTDDEDIEALRSKRGPMALGELLDRASKTRERTAVEQPTGDQECRRCKAMVTMLHTPPGEMHRTVCAVCQGQANRELCDRMGAAVRALLVADNRGAEAFLVKHGYVDTVRYLADKRRGKSPGGGGGFE